MGIIYVKDRDDKLHELKAEDGFTFMEIIRDAGMDIEAACGGCAACATCHVYFEKDWISKLPKIEIDEESMLDQAFDLTKESRLSCQIEYKEEFSGIKLKLAPK